MRWTWAEFDSGIVRVENRKRNLMKRTRKRKGYVVKVLAEWGGGPGTFVQVGASLSTERSVAEERGRRWRWDRTEMRRMERF